MYNIKNILLFFIMPFIIIVLIINIYKLKCDDILKIKNNETKEKFKKLKNLESEYNIKSKHKTICYKINELIYINDKKKNYVVNDKNQFSNNFDNKGDINGLVTKNIVQQQQQQQQPLLTTKTKLSSQIIYIFIIVLIGSLIKATLDLSKQYKMKSLDDADGADNNSRRCSVQEFNKFKHLRRNINIGQQSPLYRGSSLGTMTTIYMPTVILQNNPNSNNNNARPVPLIRRSSVPASLNQHLFGANRSPRPSIESFSEDDSSPGVKRRVRMIHRH